jgi:hypothetical protein
MSLQIPSPIDWLVPNTSLAVKPMAASLVGADLKLLSGKINTPQPMQFLLPCG